MKQIANAVIAAAAAFNLAAADAEEWFEDAKLGMFVHFGIYAVDGQGEWAMYRNGISPEAYARRAATWNPAPGCEERWVEMAKDAGFRYMVLTARHHDGFSLWDTKTDPFNSMNTPAKRDHVRAYVEACRKHGVKAGLYFSLVDWRLRDKDPEKMRAKSLAQLEELMTKYGKIDVLWYDGAWTPKGKTHAEFWDSTNLNARVRSWQPGILMNDRAGVSEDFRTIEGRNIPRPPKGATKWESCITLQDDDWSFWGWCRYTAFRKTPEQVLCQLLHCLELGGNLLVNIGPDANGGVDGWQRDLFAKLGGWVRRNADAVYGTRPTEIATTHPLAHGWTGNSCGFFTVRPGTDDAYLFFHAWPGTETTFPHFTAEVKAIELNGRPVAFVQDLAAKRLTLTGLPAAAPDPLCTVLRMKLGGKR
ncbi:MAG: alpha-L-fucosidase [Kiritimatiellae bacterium]|nr:alpha-L-fucosidase [Kiritimatiellia bacterium]